MCDLEIPALYVKWKVNNTRDKRNMEIRSSSFLFQGTQWNLRYGFDDAYHHYLDVLPVTEDGNASPYVCTVHVLSGSTGKILPQLSDTERVEEYPYIAWPWTKHDSEILESDPSFRETSDLHFLVVLKVDDALTGEGDIPSRTDAAVPTSPCTSPIAEYHLQPSCSTSVHTSSRFNPTPCLESLSEDLEKLLVADSDPDIELHCEGRTFKAHKNVLSVRSPVLKSMLHSDMVEGKTGVVDIQDMDVDTFQRFLRYLYTGRLDELTVESATSLYEAGDMFEVLSLVGRCSKYLVDNLTMENACDVLAMADAHSDEEMAETVIVFILEKKLPLSDDLWSGFCDSHSKLANKVFARFCKMLSK